MPRGRPRKKPTDRADTAVAELEPVKEPSQPSQYDQFPKESEVKDRPKKTYRFIHNQQPGSDLEATPGVTVVKNTGQLGTVYEKYHLTDGEIYDLPVDIVNRWKKLTYDQNGAKRVRFVFEEV